jgi:hypothetical protein
MISALSSAPFFLESTMLRRYRFELILILLIICALVASRFSFTKDVAATRYIPTHRSPEAAEKAPRPSSSVWRNAPLTNDEPPE